MCCRVDLDGYLEPYRAGANRVGVRMTREFAGKVAFITGAAHGQGRATALALAAEGARIAAFDVARPLAYPGYDLGSPGELASLAGACEALDVECLTFSGDVRDDAAISAAVATTVERFGAHRHLFNNAGIARTGCRTSSVRRMSGTA